MSLNLRKQIYQGNYQQVLAATLDSGRTLRKEMVIPVLSALSNRGRLAEAVSYFKAWEGRLSRADLIEARFFLGIGYCRHSHYTDARRVFGSNLRERSRRPALSPISQFYVYEGLGFYRYFCGRYFQAKKFANQAMLAATKGKFVYGKIQALDLLGHSLVQLGEVNRGLAQMQQAEKLARGLGNGSLANGFRIAIAIYRAQFGLDTDAISTIQKLSEKSRSEDVYSRASLHLELARQHCLRGQLDHAQRILDEACPLIYAVKHRRFAAILNIRYAYLHFLRGDLPQSLNLIRSAGNELHAEVDRGIEIEVRGLEWRVLTALGLDQVAEVKTRIEQLTKDTRRFVSRRILARTNGSNLTAAIGEDRIGDLMDRARENEAGVQDEILQKEMLGLLRPHYPLHRRVVDFSFKDPYAIFAERGNLVLSEDSATPAVKAFLMLVANTNVSRAKIVQALWKYSYEPSRHDSLLFQLVSRVRRFLGPHAAWLTPSDNGYRLQAEVRFAKIQATELAEITEPVLASAWQTMNVRQLKLMRQLKKVTTWSVDAHRNTFNVSPMTARRDLVELCNQGILVRLGRARATHYVAAHTVLNSEKL